MAPLFESLHTDVKLAVTVTDWMWFPWLEHLGLVAMVVSCVLLRFVAIAILCKICLTGAQRGVQILTLDMWE